MPVLVLPSGVTIATEARAERVSFSDNMLHCHLEDGRGISVPLTWYPRLRDATDNQRNNWELVGPGIGIHWPELDEDLSVEGFMAGCTEAEESAS